MSRGTELQTQDGLAIEAYGRLQKDCQAWQPTDADCFHVLAKMTASIAPVRRTTSSSVMYLVGAPEPPPPPQPPPPPDVGGLPGGA